MSKHRFILVGHGGIARSYFSILRALPQTEIVGVIGRNLERVKQFATISEIPHYGIDIEEVAAASDATAAIICTPNSLHVDGVLKAAKAGLHILCEKPLAIQIDDQQQMIDICKAYNVKLSVCYMRRFTPHIQWLKRAIEAGRLGDIRTIDIQLKHFRNEQYYQTWHGTKEFDGGGPFIQQGSHMIDLALWLCNGYKEVIYARCFNLLHNIETEDHGYALVSYQNGAVGMITMSTACVGMDLERIEISGTKGHVVADFNQIISYHLEDGADDAKSFLDQRMGESKSLLTKLVHNFIQAMEEDTTPYITGESAAIVTELVKEIYAKSS